MTKDHTDRRVGLTAGERSRGNASAKCIGFREDKGNVLDEMGRQRRGNYGGGRGYNLPLRVPTTSTHTHRDGDNHTYTSLVLLTHNGLFNSSGTPLPVRD